ncbi:MAG TPA: methyl-accepting chemotaxis protein [Burkholderiaceae bacterium]|nr:methyl-accepting chemotaxis protein [Burkholderiaceae bacterium]
MNRTPLKLSTRLQLGFAFVMLLMALAALAGFVQLRGALQVYEVELAEANRHERAIRAIETQFKEQVQEWKNVLLRGKDPEQLRRYWDAFEKREKAVVDGAATLLTGGLEPKVRELLEAFGKAHAEMGVRYRKGLETFRASDFAHDRGDAAVRGVDRDAVRLLDEATHLIEKREAALAETATARSRRAQLVTLAAVAAVALLGLALGWWISRSVLRVLGGEPADAVLAAQRVAQGDLTIRPPTRDGDRTSLMANLATMQASLATLVEGIRAGAEQIRVATTEVSQGNVDLSSRTEQQSSSLQETASAMEELTGTVRQTADNARSANQLAQASRETAMRGGEVVERVVRTMASISESAGKVREIITVIDGIAFQTNILALNAAVEAARAGEQGRGFAVVASEVRTLAQRSADAAREIKRLIEDSVSKVSDGTELVGQAGTTMGDVVQSVRRVTDLIGEITSAAEQQSSGIEQVNLAVAQLDAVTQQNAALVEEAAAATQSMEQQSRLLVDAVSVFRVPADAAGPADRSGPTR